MLKETQLFRRAHRPMPAPWKRWYASTLSSGISLSRSFDPRRMKGVLPPRALRHEFPGEREGKGMQMHQTLRNALAAGYERIVAWADILDRINVYPVPDGDTGRNLVMTLSALRNPWQDEETLSQGDPAHGPGQFRKHRRPFSFRVPRL